MHPPQPSIAGLTAISAKLRQCVQEWSLQVYTPFLHQQMLYWMFIHMGVAGHVLIALVDLQLLPTRCTRYCC